MARAQVAIVSTDLAIAGVTAVLRAMLHGGLVDHVPLGSQGPVTITAEAPDRIKTDAVDLPDQINLFMYHVTPNAAWRNWDMPSRDAAGSRISNPPLALDLYYLVTAYSQKQLYADVLLGYAMQYLHEIAVLTGQRIQDALSTAGDLTAADVLDQVEQIKHRAARHGQRGDVAAVAWRSSRVIGRRRCIRSRWCCCRIVAQRPRRCRYATIRRVEHDLETARRHQGQS